MFPSTDKCKGLETGWHISNEALSEAYSAMNMFSLELGQSPSGPDTHTLLSGAFQPFAM